MIEDDSQLQQTREAEVLLEDSLAILQRDRTKLHPDRYALMAAPILDDLHKIRQEIDDYLGRHLGHSSLDSAVVKTPGAKNSVWIKLQAAW